MDIKDLYYVEFKKIEKGYSYVFISRTGFLLRKYIKFTAKTMGSNLTWRHVESLMKQHNYFIHDLANSGWLSLGDVKVWMEVFNKFDFQCFGKKPEHWEELGQIALQMQKDNYVQIRKHI